MGYEARRCEVILTLNRGVRPTCASPPDAGSEHAGDTHTDRVARNRICKRVSSAQIRDASL